MSGRSITNSKILCKIPNELSFLFMVRVLISCSLKLMLQVPKTDEQTSIWKVHTPRILHIYAGELSKSKMPETVEGQTDSNS